MPGCPNGYVCIYPGKTFASGTPLRYWSYGTYNLHNEYGDHLVVNHQFYDNQYHEARWVDLRSRYNGGGQEIEYLSEGDYEIDDLTPVNSFVMTAIP